MFGRIGRTKARDLEARLDAISGSQAMIEFALDGTIVTANTNFLNLMGYALPEIAGRNHAMFMVADEQTLPAYRDFWERLRRGDHQTGVFKHLTADRREVWLQATYNPILDAAGRLTGVVKLATDVTRARREAADANGQVQAIRRSQAVIEFDLAGHVLTANDAFLHTMGYELKEIVGRHHAMFMPDCERDTDAYRAFWAALGRGEYVSGVFKRIDRTGQQVWLQASYNAILDPDGKPMKIVKFGTDVTQARLLSADHQGQIAAIDRSQAVIEFGLDGTILSANENFLTASGYRLGEVVGQHHSMFVTPEECAAPEYKAFWADLARGAFRTGEFRRVRKDGSVLWLRATYNAVRDLDGAPFKVVKFATDVTTQVQARASFSALVEDVAGAAEQLSSSINEISATMARSQSKAEAAVHKVADAGQSTQRLNQAVQAMGRVVDLIDNVTQQINLLALNATIEAARAGDAGRGFTVVANEVKNLASQAKRATQEITAEINGVRQVSGDVVGALSAIREAIDAVSSFVTSTAAAVEEQNTVTETISVSMQTAAQQVGELWAA